MPIKFSTISPRPLNVAGIKLELINAMRDMGVEIRENFEDTVQTWQHKPSWEPPFPIPVVGMDKITVETTTVDKVYGWVSEGTKSHPIFPKNAKALAFPGQFIPKTFPGVIHSGSGLIGPVDQFRDWVAHPGVEARNFDKEIAIRQEKIFKISMERAMRLAAKASGHWLR